MSIRSVDISEQVYGKLEWAEKHIFYLHNFWVEFVETNNPYPVESKRDPDTGKHIFRLTNVAPIPPDFRLKTGDIIHNLRAALDHLVYRLALMNGRSPKSLTHLYFPVGESPKEFKAKIKAVKKCLKPAAVKILKEIEAHPRSWGPGQFIWQLHKLNNIDKHRLLLTITSQNRAYSASPESVALVRKSFLGMATVPTDMDYRLFQTGRDVPLVDLKAGDILGSFDESEMQPKMHFPVEVAFREPEVFDVAVPVIPVLQRMSDSVRVAIQTCDTADLLE